MKLSDLRLELEEDLSWRLDELRHLRNELLAGSDPESWPVSALRAILVMQYAHLEGFARQAFGLYIDAINAKGLKASELKPHLFASACISEFEALRTGATGQSDERSAEEGILTRRAVRQVDFIQKIRALNETPVTIDPQAAASMEMNFGTDVLRRTLYRLGIPESEVSRSYFHSLEFVRRTRNDIAHGSRRSRIDVRLFDRHRRKCEQFMDDLARLITSAVSREWFRPVAMQAIPEPRTPSNN
ncbi:MAE_28990/MAE_18760 family HEPN-like nuclease [Micromonospora sp. CV4]|uniref:MAE_28990/MAE_18760 family HEPN-like nuclease n=1 Tax=Micromonospora sp. CV4 TaxID=2478711 RepID=UPI0011C4A1A7|nr:MAE_28990/MAE_18760 family HEPN-like nuclease [Micromonospora sp. CV4]